MLLLERDEGVRNPYLYLKEIGLAMEELMVSEKSRLNGAALIDSGIRQEMDVIIVAVRKKNGDMEFSFLPDPH